MTAPSPNRENAGSTRRISIMGHNGHWTNLPKSWLMQLSIVIPLGPEEPYPEKLVHGLNTGLDEVEILLATTGQHAGPEISAELPEIKVIAGSAGRGRQLNRAADAARGRWLWLIHADSHLPDHAVTQVLEWTRQAQTRLGFCHLRFAEDGPWLTHLNAVGANLRSRWLQMPYGDQTLCLPGKWFERLGGFREDLERGEDLDLVVRARRAGLPIEPIGLTVTTSARRYAQHGWLRNTWQHQVNAMRLIRRAST